MPPANKRKRPDRTTSSDEIGRPSPHRPADLDLAKQGQPLSPSQTRDSPRNPPRPTRESIQRDRNVSLPAASSIEASTDTTHRAAMKPANTLSAETPTVNGDHANQDKSTQQDKEEKKKPIPPSRSDVIIMLNLPVYFTDEILQNWDGDGQAQIKTMAKLMIDEENDEDLRQLVQGLVLAALRRKVLPATSGAVLKEISVRATPETDEKKVHAVHDALMGVLSILYGEDSPFPYIPELAEFLLATEIDPDVLRLGLEVKLLTKLGLVSSIFGRMQIRTQTNLLYRQANFNLLREESEGFSKVMNELFTTSGSEAPTNHNVQEAVEKVKAMIGSFDLDVGRTLDVVLDVFGSVLVKQYRFFVKFLRASPWWPNASDGGSIITSGLPRWALPDAVESSTEQLSPHVARNDEAFWSAAETQGLKAFFRLGRQIVREDEIDAVAELFDDDDEYRAQWVRETGTMPPHSNRDAAQLLGFKLRYYQPGSGGDPLDSTARNLIYLAALFIKIGFVSLHDLYPHLWRSDSDMDALKEQKKKEKAERERAARPGAGARNALLTAGALADDTVTAVPSRLRENNTRASTPSRESQTEKLSDKETQAEAPDQKVSLLQALLAIGALPEALFILGRFPWLLEFIPELPQYINRILHHALSGIYPTLRPLGGRQSLRDRLVQQQIDLPGFSKSDNIREDPSSRKTLRWPLLDRDDSDNDGFSYKFYWDDWNDNIPICHSIDDFFVLTKTFLPLVGAKIGQDPSLVLKIARIGKNSLRNDGSEQNRQRWLDLSKRTLLPSLSLTKANPGVVNEVFEMLSFFSTDVRYLMYLEWLSGRTSRSADMRSAFDQARAETRDILKRISKTNIRPMARALAKVAYANPHIVITTALNQIESYDSIADVFVEGARYFTDLGYDVLTWALVSSMNKAGRRRVQEDGIFTSKWLIALANFAGKIYKRYALMKAGPVLQYVSVQLENGISTDLIMLEQVISSMAGIAPDNNFNDTQLQAMGGGSLLQSQTILQLLDTRHTSKPTSKRLLKALNDHGLAAKILISVAQLRQNCVYKEKDVPLKAMSHMFDEITRVLGQYLELLRSNTTVEEFGTLVPDVIALMIEYDLPAEIAFWISRPVIARNMVEFDKENMETNKEAADSEAPGDVKMDDEDSEEDGEADETEEVSTSAPTPIDSDMIANGVVENTDTQVVVEEKWHPVLLGIMDDLRYQLPSDLAETVGVGFYTTFWQLSAYDIFVPSSYGEEIQRQKKKIASITADRSNVSVHGTRQKEGQIKQVQELIDNLMAENRQHVNAKNATSARLREEMPRWFVDKARVSTELNVALMEHCFLPRMLLSPLDAYFCFKMVKTMHSIGTPNFRTLGFYDQFFKAERLSSLIFTCTSKESDNFGRFMHELLKDLAKWHGRKPSYEAGAWGNKAEKLPGFALKIENGRPVNLLDHDGFRKVLYKWHSGLMAALSKCLESIEYMHVRNAISVLRTISPTWPAVKHHGETLKTAIEALGTSDKEDIKVSSQALLGGLTRRMKQWVSPKLFTGQDVAVEEAKTRTSQPPVPTPVREVKREEPSTAEDEMLEKKDSSKSREAERPKLASHSDTEHRSASRGPSTRSSLPPRPARPADTKANDLPRKVEPPSRNPPSSLPSRPTPDTRGSYREPRGPPKPPQEPNRPDSRPGYPRSNASDRAHDQAYERGPRYPSHPERAPVLDRDSRPRREQEERPHDDRRYQEREPRHERERERELIRAPDRELPRGSERDYSNRPIERDFGRGYPEAPPDRRRHEAPPERRPDPAPSSRSAPVSDPAPSINPARAALINGEDSRAGMSIRGQASDRPRNSRPPSPRREEERKYRSDREERPDRRPETPSRQNDLMAPVSAPPRSAPPVSRDVRSHGRPQVDMAHGRLEQEPHHRAPPRDRAGDNEPPSGPRQRPSSSSLRTAQPPPASPRGPQQSASDRLPPSGPGGRHTRNSSVQEPPPVSTPDTSGIHPSRLGHISPTEPSRGKNNQLPNPIPSGPRGNGPPTGPSAGSPISRNPPSGPQSDNSRNRGRDVMTSVNSTLAQAARGPNGSSTRGRGNGNGNGRPSSSSFSSNMAPPNVQGPRGDYSNQAADPMSGNPNGIAVQPRVPSRQDSLRDEDRGGRSRGPRRDDDHARGDREPKDDGRSSRRDEAGHPPRRDPRGHQGGPPPSGPSDAYGQDTRQRKHAREDSYGSGARGGRGPGDSKRPRRGG